MGSNYNSYGGKCGCTKRAKKAQRVPQRGPGVAELEKILSDQKHDQIKPMYTPNGSSIYNQPHYHPMMPPTLPVPRPLPVSHFHQHFSGGVGNVYLKPCRSDGVLKSDQVILCNDSGISFTQMMMADLHDSNPNANPMLQTNMNYTPGPNVGFNHFNKHCHSQRFNNKCAQQLGHTSGSAILENERIVLRNILTLGPSTSTNGSSSLPSNPIFIESDSSEEQCKDPKVEESLEKSHKSQIFGFTMQDQKYLSLDETKLSLHHNHHASHTEELSLDLTLKL